MRQEIKVAIIVVLLVVSFFIGFYFNGVLTGKAVEIIEEEYSYTKAICGDFGCLDLLVKCFNGEMNITPITKYQKMDLSDKNISNLVRC